MGLQPTYFENRCREQTSSMIKRTNFEHGFREMLGQMWWWNLNMISCQHGFEHRASIGRVQRIDGNGVMLDTFKVGD